MASRATLVLPAPVGAHTSMFSCDNMRALNTESFTTEEKEGLAHKARRSFDAMTRWVKQRRRGKLTTTRPRKAAARTREVNVRSLGQGAALRKTGPGCCAACEAAAEPSYQPAGCSAATLSGDGMRGGRVRRLATVSRRAATGIDG
eukprot:3810991-Pleurochrysis_carterae.AAC.3